MNLVTTSQYFAKYIVASSLYGGVRKTYQLTNATSGYDINKNPLPMLIGDKVIIIGLSSLFGYLLTPMWLHKDINFLHRKINNISEVEYTSVEPLIKKHKGGSDIISLIFE